MQPQCPFMAKIQKFLQFEKRHALVENGGQNIVWLEVIACKFEYELYKTLSDVHIIMLSTTVYRLTEQNGELEKKMLIESSRFSTDRTFPKGPSVHLSDFSFVL